jgi:hypothetical protein
MRVLWICLIACDGGSAACSIQVSQCMLCSGGHLVWAHATTDRTSRRMRARRAASCCPSPAYRYRRAGDLFGQRNILLKARAVLTRGLAGVDNVYTQVRGADQRPVVCWCERKRWLAQLMAQQGSRAPRRAAASGMKEGSAGCADCSVLVCCCCLVFVCLQHVPLLSETLRMLAANDLSAAAYPYAAGSQVQGMLCWCWSGFSGLACSCVLCACAALVSIC